MACSVAAAAISTVACTEAGPARTVDGRCEPAPLVVGDLTDGLIQHEAVLNVHAVKSNDFESIWFISADLEGPGLDGNDDIATWVTTSLDGSGEINSVNSLAVEHSIWAQSKSMDDDGAQESANCARGSGPG
jgi:hypothetical protein